MAGNARLLSRRPGEAASRKSRRAPAGEWYHFGARGRELARVTDLVEGLAAQPRKNAP